MDFLFPYLKWNNKLMLKIINLITNNYFLKQKLQVPLFEKPIRRLTDTWRGNTQKGRRILDEMHTTSNISNFHNFLFLRDLRAEGSLKSRSTARTFVNNWIEEKHNLVSKIYDATTISSRIIVWSFCYTWFAESGERNFQKKLLNSIAFQAKYLELKLEKSIDSLERIIIIKGIIIAKSILYEEIKNISTLIELIDIELQFLINKDGGHVTRSPVLQIQLLRHLIEIRSVIAVLKNIDTKNLHTCTIKMGEFCRSFQMPNENLAWFNGGSIVSKDLIKQTLNRIGYKNKIFHIAEETGFCRISNQDIVLMADIGTKKNLKKQNKAGLFSFEFYYKKQKIISNLGDVINSSTINAHNSLASSAAHSTLSIDDRNNIDLSGNRKTETLNLEIGKAAEGNLIDITHSGYELIFGVHHRRRIYLSKNKGEIRGQDDIINFKNIGSIPKKANIRFHLHPEINLIKVRNGSILLKHKKGFIWKMIADNNDIVTQESIMFFPSGPQKCQQIIINLNLENIRSNKIESCNWAFELQN